MSTLRRGRLLIYQLQRLRLRRRLRNRKSSKHLQIESKRRFLFRTLVLGIFRTGSVRMYLPSMPSSGHTWKCILKRQLSEFEQFFSSKTLVDLGVRTPICLTMIRIVTITLHVFSLQTFVPIALHSLHNLLPVSADTVAC